MNVLKTSCHTLLYITLACLYGVTVSASQMQHVRVNMGCGKEITFGHEVWLPELGLAYEGKIFVNGFAFDRGQEQPQIEGTDRDVLFLSERYGTTDFPLSVEYLTTPGEYTVVLHFVYLMRTLGGVPPFDVQIEGEERELSLDIARDAGGAYVALSRTYHNVTVDDYLSLYFPGGGELAAFELIPTGDVWRTPLPYPSPTPTCTPAHYPPEVTPTPTRKHPGYPTATPTVTPYPVRTATPVGNERAVFMLSGATGHRGQRVTVGMTAFSSGLQGTYHVEIDAPDFWLQVVPGSIMTAHGVEASYLIKDGDLSVTLDIAETITPHIRYGAELLWFEFRILPERLRGAIGVWPRLSVYKNQLRHENEQRWEFETRMNRVIILP